MTDVERDLELYQRFRKLGEKLKRYGAVTYIMELWENPEKRINPIQLYTLYQEEPEESIADTDEEFYYYTLPRINYRPPERSIELTDLIAIKQVKKALGAAKIVLAREKANRNLAKVDELQEGIAQMEAYLYNSLTLNGKIRTVGNLTQRYYLLIYRACNTLIKALNRIDSELADYIHCHVKIASMCYWSEEPMIIRKRKKRKKQAAIIIMEDDIVIHADGQRPA